MPPARRRCRGSWRSRRPTSSSPVPGQRGRGQARPASRPSDADPDRSRRHRRAYGARGRATSGPALRPGAFPGVGWAPGTSGSARTGQRVPEPRPSQASPGRPGRAREDRLWTAAGGEDANARGRIAGTDPRGPSAADGAADARDRVGAWVDCRRSGVCWIGRAGGARAARDADGTRRRSGQRRTTASTDPFEPDWRGASWYGTTSGTYWTLNPKEYADPRKHGPEYQARARRTSRRSPEATRRRPPTRQPMPDGTRTRKRRAESARDPVGRRRPATPPAATPAEAGPTHTTTLVVGLDRRSTAGAGLAEAGAEAPARPIGPQPGDDRLRRSGGRHASTDRHRTSAAPWPTSAAPSPMTGLGGFRGRVVRAVIGWLPIAFGIGWLVGELTGCGRFAATCDGSADPFVLALQIAVLASCWPSRSSPRSTTMAPDRAARRRGRGRASILSATGSAADGESRRSRARRRSCSSPGSSGSAIARSSRRSAHVARRRRRPVS